MAQITERIQGHPIWQILENLGPAIDNALAREGVDAQSTEALSRLKSVLAFTGRRLAGADPFLIQTGSLDSLNNALQAALQEVQNFIANGNAGHITNANAQADSALTYLSQLNVPLTTEDFLAAREAAETYRRGLDKALTEVTAGASKLSTDIVSLARRLDELSEGMTAEKSKLSTLSSDFQTQFSTAQESRTRDFAAAQKEQQDRSSTLFTDFTQKLGAQNTDFTKQREDIARLHQSELETLKKQFVDESTKLREEMLERKKEIEELVGVIGNLGVTSGYLNTANEAKGAVRIWQRVTVAAMVGLIVIAIVAFLPVVSGGFSWSSFAGRVFISLTFGILAAYAASQADKYQKVERQNRRLALELEAIGPFIAPLPKEKREEFRITIGERSFGHGDGAHGIPDAKSPATLVDVLLQSKESKEFRSLLTEIIKAVK
ncbi:MAG: hypothetical protein CXR31_00370 [Geobacter sp.]|nr:MAG: hypothetical protein CXR31_00370 [Geobacter sp.]